MPDYRDIPDIHINNEKGVVPGLPGVPAFPNPLAGIGGQGGSVYDNKELTLNDIFRNTLNNVQAKGIASIPVSSFDTSGRYIETRPGTDFEEMAAQQQSTADKWGNGLLKMGGLTGITAVANTAGVLAGLVEFGKTGRFASIYDNDVNRSLDGLTQEMEDAIPNYYKHAEQDAEWYSPDNLLTANFFSDKIAKNLGYSLGSMLGGMAWSKGFQMTGSLLKQMNVVNKLVQAGKGLETVEQVENAMRNSSKLGRYGAVSETLSSLSQKYLKQPLGAFFNDPQRLTISVMGTFGEAGMEALQNLNEYRDNLIKAYVAENGVMPTGDDLQEINAYADKVGNYTWGFNTALLSGTNYVQLPKILGSSRSAERVALREIEREVGKPLGKWQQAANALEATGKAGKFANRFVAKPLGKALGLLSPSEAFEEFGQFAIQTGVNDYFNSAYQNKEDVSSYLSTLGNVTKGIVTEGVDKTLSTKEGIESVLLGGVSGGLMELRNTIRQGSAKKRNTELAIKALNDTPLESMLIDQVQYAARAVNAQQRRQRAVQENDILVEKDEETNYALSFVMPRIKYGKEEAIKQELDYYRQQAASDAGFEQLKIAKIVGQKESKEGFNRRLDSLQNTANNVSKLYDTVRDKYSSIVDDKGNKLYTDEVIDKMVFASSKVKDFDDRLKSMSTDMIANNLKSLTQVNNAIANSPEWKSEKFFEVFNTPEVVKSVEDAYTEIEKMDTLADNKDQKEYLKETLIDYIETLANRRGYAEQYEQMKAAPLKFQTQGKQASIKDEEEKEKPTETFILTTARGDREFKVGESYLVEQEPGLTWDENAKIFKELEFTALGVNEDGTIRIQYKDGTIENISKDIFANARLGSLKTILSKPRAAFYYHHRNEVFTYNFGKKYKDKKGQVTGEVVGRIEYDSEEDALYFTYKKDGKVVRKLIKDEDLVAQEGFKDAKLKWQRSLVEETPEQREARLALQGEQKEGEDRVKEMRDYFTKKFNSYHRMEVVAQLQESAKKRLEEVEKKLLSKREQLDKVNKDIEELREVRVAEPRTKREKALEERYPELGRQKQRFSKVFSKTTNSLITLSKIKQEAEEEVAALEIEKDDLLFNIDYLEHMTEGIKELGEHSGQVRTTLRQQMKDLDELAKQHIKDMSLLEKIADESGRAIKSLVELLADATKQFDKDYPPYLRDAFELMSSVGAAAAQMPLVKTYFADKALMDDINREISLKQADIEEANKQIQQLMESMDLLAKESRAKLLLIKRFDEEVEIYKENKKKERALLKEAALMQKFFNAQQETEPDSGDEIEENADAEEMDKANKQINSAKHRIEVAWSSTIVSSDEAVTRPSDRRHDQFLTKIDFFPKDKRDRLRRFFVTANNEEKLNLKGITDKHLEGYVPKEGEEPILAVYVTTKPSDTFYYYVNENGDILGKVGEAVDLNKLVWAGMPSTSRYNNYGTRYSEKTPESEVVKYEQAWAKKRQEILEQTDTILEPEEFLVSNGIMMNEKGSRNFIEGTLVSKEQLDTNQPVLQISTKGSIVHQLRSVSAPTGRMYISNGGTLRIVNNRNLIEKEVDTLFEVLKAFAREAVTTKKFNPLYVKYLQGLLYFDSPYSKTKEGKEFKKKTARNQMYFRSGYFYFGKNEVKVPFTEKGVEANEEDIKFFLRNAYNNVNNRLLKQNEPFQELGVEDGKVVVKKEWNSYQHYLLSAEGRTPEEVPLYTDIRPISSAIPGDSNYEKGSRSTYVYYDVPEEVNPPQEIEEEEETKPTVKSKKVRTEDGVKPAPEGEEATDVVSFEEDVPESLLEGYTEAEKEIIRNTLRSMKSVSKKGDKKKAAAEKAPAPTPTKNPIKATKAQAEEQKEKPASKPAGLGGLKGAIKSGRNKAGKLEEGEEAGESKDIAAPAPQKSSQAVLPSDEDDSQYRLSLGVLYDIGDTQAEMEYIQKNTPFDVQVIENLIDAGNGVFAFGSYSKGLITLSKQMEVGTGYHEMFEGVYDVFLSAKEKARIYNEFASREGTFTDRETGQTVAYKDATLKQAKEQMAEEFRDKKLYGIDPPAAKTNWIKSFFQKLLDFINKLLDPASVRSLNEVFQRMDTAYYKNARLRSIPAPGEQYRLKVGSLDVKDSYTVVRAVVGRIFKKLLEDGRYDILNELDFSSFKADTTYEQILQDINRTFDRLRAANNWSAEEFENSKYGAVLNSIKDNWEKVKEYSREMLKTFKIIEEISEESREGEETTYAGNTSDSYVRDMFAYDSKVNAPASVKLLIATIQESVFADADGKLSITDIAEGDTLKKVRQDIDQSTALEKMIDYANMFNYTMNQLLSYNTLAEKEAYIRKLADTNPNYVRLFNRLRINKNNSLSLDEWALKIKFYTTMAKQRPSALINFIEKDGSVSIGEANVLSSSKLLTNDFLNSLKDFKETKFLQDKGRFIINLKERFKDKQTNNPARRFAFLRELGINFTKKQQSSLSKDDKEDLAEKVESLRLMINKGDIDITNMQSSKLEGTLTDIFKMFIKSDNVQPDTTMTNLEGQKVQQVVQTNAISRIANDLNNSLTYKEAIERLPHLASEYSQDSMYLKEVMFDALKGESKSFNIQTKYIMGVVDKRYNDNTPTDKLSEADRLMQAINQNFAGNYYVLLNADSKTEFMVGLENRFKSVDKKFLEQAHKYYQTEQRLGTSKNRIFNFLEDGLTETAFNSSIKQFVKDEVKKQRDILTEFGMLKRSRKNADLFTWTGVYEKLFSEGYYKDYNRKQLTTEQVDELLTYRTINFIVNNTEIHKIFFGDPAAYDDPTKRYKSFQSGREQALYDTPQFDAVANANYNTVDGTPLKKGDPGYTLYNDVLKTVVVSDVLTSENLPGYEKGKSTDGQGIATLTGYKKIMVKNGFRWYAGDETQYQYKMAQDRLAMEEDGLFSYKGRESLKSHDEELVAKGDPKTARLSPIKPIVSGFADKHPILDKMSIYGFSYNDVRGTTLGQQYARMLKEDISYMVFPSARKVGVVAEDSMYTEDHEVNTAPFKQAAITNVPFKWFGIQVETRGDEKKQTMGSQTGKLITVNLMDAAVPVDYKGTFEQWSAMSEEERLKTSRIYKLVKKEEELRDELIKEGYRKLLKKIGVDSEGFIDSKKLLDSIKEELTRRDLNENLRSALEIDEETGDFKIPLEALNNFEQIRNIIFSYIDKYIASPKMSGGAKIQISGSGWEVAGKRIKSTEIVDKKTGKKRVVYTSAGLAFYTKDKPYMEVMLPAWFGEKLRRAGLDLDNINLEDLDPEILMGIGFRIPTQELNSIEYFKVVAFLPESMGDAVVVPESIVTKTGADFDVDKLNTYLKNVYIENGEVKLVPTFETREEAETFFSDKFDRDLARRIASAEKQVDFKDRLLRVAQSSRMNLPMTKALAKFLLKKSTIQALNSFYSESMSEEELLDADQRIIDSIVALGSKLESYSDVDLQRDLRKLYVERMYRASLENSYYKVFGDLLTLDENFDRLTAPNHSDDLMEARDLLEKINPQEFGEGSIKTVISPSYMNRIRHNYLLGKGGVGIAAVQQVSNALTQKSPILLNPSLKNNLTDDNERLFIGDAVVKLPANTVKINGTVYHTLSKMKDVVETYISSKISQYINGFVDVAKDSFLVQLGVTRANASTYLLLERFGVPTKTVLMFMNQPIIREFQKAIQRSEFPNYFYQEDIVKDVMEMFPSKREDTTFGDITKETGVDSLNKKLEDNIRNFYGENKREFYEQENATQKFILREFLKYNVMASNMFRFVQATTWDTANLNSPYLVRRKQLRLQDKGRDGRNENNIFSSAGKMMDSTFLRPMSNAIIKASKDLSNGLFTMLQADVQPYFLPIIDTIAKMRINDRDFLRNARRVEEAFVDYLIQQSTNLNTLIDDLLVNKDSSFLKQVAELKEKLAKQEDSALLQNPIISRLIADNRVTATQTKTVKIFNKQSDVFSQNIDIAAMEELKDNPLTEELYYNLVNVAFLQSGVGRSPISFADIIPVEDFSKVVETGLDFLSKTSEKKLEAFMQVGAFYRNNWKNSDVVNVVKEYEDVEKTRQFSFPANVENYANAIGLKNLIGIKVSTKSKAFASPFALFVLPTGQQILVRRVEKSDGTPYKRSYDYAPAGQYAIYVGVNAWGDGINGKEYYDYGRKSSFNNGTVSFEQEIPNEVLVELLSDSKRSVEPTNVTRVKAKEIVTPTVAKAATPRTVAIVGTAGRKVAPTKKEWENMVKDAESRVSEGDTLISGGAAYADHIAVRLFLDGNVSGLILRLPAPFKNGEFEGGYGTSGGAANYYHEAFSKILGVDTRDEIQQAIDEGAEVTYEPLAKGYDAMKKRNTKVAQESSALIAYTFNEGNEPSDGGTKDTWDKHKGEKTHVSIKSIGTKKATPVAQPVGKAPVKTTEKTLGEIKLNIIENWVQSGQATTTVRSDTYHQKFYKGDGVYTTEAGNLVNVTYRGLIKVSGDKVLGKGVSYSKDAFAKAEGFGNWKNFEKEAQYAGKSLIAGQSVHLYDIIPATKPVTKAAVKTEAAPTSALAQAAQRIAEEKKKREESKAQKPTAEIEKYLSTLTAERLQELGGKQALLDRYNSIPFDYSQQLFIEKLKCTP